MTFDSTDLEQCPLLLQDENAGRYYDSFAEPPGKPFKNDIRKATTAKTVEEEIGNRSEQINRPSSTIHYSEYLEADGGSAVTESSESLDSTQSSTPNNEEEISYYAFPMIPAPGDPTEIRHKQSGVDWATLGRPYESFLGYSKTKLSKFKQGMKEWILVALVGCLSALLAFAIDNFQAILFDVKYGFCSVGDCHAWRGWSSLFQTRPSTSTGVDILIYVSLVLMLSAGACALTLLSRTKTSNSSRDAHGIPINNPKKSNPSFIPAAGSGVREIKLIINGFWLEGYLTGKTILIKSIAMILSTASGLSIGKEGPFIHLGTGISAWVSRIFDVNQGEVRQLLLCAGAASGLAVAFSAPISGVVFVLEELSITWTPKHLMLILFCSIVSSLCLILLEPFGNRMPVLIDVQYTSDWKLFELIAFVFLGALGGVLGALFIKACRFWAGTYRRIPIIKNYPLMDIVIVALLTGLSSYWNKYTKLGDSELLSNLAATCSSGVTSFLGLGNCGSNEPLSTLLMPLAIAFVVKGILTTVSFGLCVPAGIYVPSMATGALIGKAVGYSVEALSWKLPIVSCPTEKGVSCVNPDVYALIGAGAMMCGVTRLPVTLTIILFELTGSLNYMACFCIAIFVAKWSADCIESYNIYDLVGDLHGYPRLDKELHEVTGTLGDLLPSISQANFSIDITSSPIVPSSVLQQRLNILLLSNDLDGGLVIIAHGIPVNFINTSSLKKAMGTIRNGSTTACLLSSKRSDYPQQGIRLYERESDLASYFLWHGNEADLTSYLLPPPITLELQAPIAFVADCFRKLGLEYICAVQNGKYLSLVRKQDLCLWGAFRS